MNDIKYKLIKRDRSPYYLLRLTEKCSDGWQEKSTKQKRRRDAERAAIKILASIGITEKKRITWKAFRENYEADHLSKMKRPGCFKSAARKLEELSKPAYVDEMTAAKMKQFRQKMEKAGMKATTIASYLKHVRASLGWAEESGYIDQAPRVKTGSTGVMKGRPITCEEFERMLLATTKIVGSERAKGWKRLLRGLWLTGLRLQEAIDFDWTSPARIRPINLTGVHPMLCYPGSMQKNGKDQLVPMVPDAAKFLLETPKSKRNGPVFMVMGRKHWIRSADRASRIISDIGERARIITKVNPETGKKQHATAHDLRRSFATRWARKIPKDLLAELMRHADAKTTQGPLCRNRRRTASGAAANGVAVTGWHFGWQLALSSNQAAVQ